VNWPLLPHVAARRRVLIAVLAAESVSRLFEQANNGKKEEHG